ncbi:FAD-dependent monooxygenase [Thermomonospora amylolytica]|uniref:FAD-dependent monooxygenase n=1 Tax=Thermomonospora amylolytica TaxID=1411117 RepID=UPI000E6CDAEA|nr:FAD-dependent monooxygenase [Thermomonospora amylolytica]
MEHAEVLVVGAGPTGLLLAGDLAAAGVGCVVVERREEESNLSRAFAVHARTLEQLDARGLADELIATGAVVRRLRLFGETELDLSVLPGRFPYVLITPQYQTERLLEARARAYGAEFRPGTEVVALRQDPAGVDVTVRDRRGRTRRIRARYVVGADGVHSTVRRTLGLDFPGRSVVRSVMLADVRLTRTPPEVVTVNADGGGFAFLAPFGDGWYRVIAWNRRRQLPDDAPVELAEIREVVRRALGTDYGMHDPRWMSRFHSDERQVPRYRSGRVFLAGDAAHVHSPAGGMGMNTGLQDAANLGWKLAAAVHGWAPPDLLDSYHAERHPVGRTVLRASGALVRTALLGPRPLRAARGTLARAAMNVRPLVRRAAGTVSGIDIACPRPPGEHPLTGRRAPDVPLAGGRRLYEALRDGRFLLVAPPGERPRETAVVSWSDRVQVTEAGAPTRHTVLVRPDAYIAWAADHPRPVTAVQTALHRHCGAPTAPALQP